MFWGSFACDVPRYDYYKILNKTRLWKLYSRVDGLVKGWHDVEMRQI